MDFVEQIAATETSETAPAPTMSLEDVRRSMGAVLETNEWKLLSKQQKTFVENVIAFDRDYVFAAQVSFNVKNRRNAQITASKLQALPHVRTILEMLFNVQRDEQKERRDFFAALEKRICSGKKMSPADCEITRAILQARGWEMPPNIQLGPSRNGYLPASQRPAQPKRYKVGDHFFQDGYEYKATAVDANGTVTAADAVTGIK